MSALPLPLCYDCQQVTSGRCGRHALRPEQAARPSPHLLVFTAGTAPRDFDVVDTWLDPQIEILSEDGAP